MSWSKIPMPLRIAALSTIALAGVQLALQPFSSLAFESRAWMFRSGLAYTAKCFAIFGAIELATLLHKRAAIGAKLAAAGWASTIVFGFIQIGISMADAWKDPLALTMQWLWWVALLAVGVGLAFAAMRRPLLAIAGGVTWLLVERPPVFDNWMWRQLIDHSTARLAISTAQLVLQGAVVLWLAAVAVGDVPAGFVVRDPQRIRWGHTKIANSLWLRVIASAALPLVTLVLMGSHGSESFKALGYAMIGAGIVTMLSFLAFGLGALDAARANEPDLRRGPFYLAAAASLWCAGVTLFQLPELHQTLFGEHTGFLGERSAEAASAFAIVLPLVGAAAILLWTVGAGGFAIRRERLDLAERAPRTGVWFVVLTGAALGVTQWLLPEARSDGAALLLLLLALACSVIATVNAARLAQDTAELANVEQPTIPTATIV